MSKFKLILGSCTEGPDFGCPDLMVTSPPYKDEDGYTVELIHALALRAHSCMTDDALVFVNFGQLSKHPGRPFQVVDLFCTAGFVLRQTVVWIKSVVVDDVQRGHYLPINSDFLLNYCFEYIFIFERAPKAGRRFDRLSIGCQFADKSNLLRGTRGQHGDRHCAGDCWFIPYKTTGAKVKKAHAYEYPFELPLRCLRLAGAGKGTLVWDPFCGSGSTALAAKRLRADFVGHEVQEQIAEAAAARWRDARGGTE